MHGIIATGPPAVNRPGTCHGAMSDNVGRMRLGVLDVGSNTVHLLVVDAHRGARPIPAYSHKEDLRLADHITGGRLTEDGETQLLAFVTKALEIAEDKGVQNLLGFATSAVREAANGLDVLDRINTATGADLQVLPGDEEARLTFLAVRRWFGWSSGRLLVIDIGGGSLEIASGIDEAPDTAISLPLGVGRLSRDRLSADPPPPEELRELRRYVRAQIAARVGEVTRYGPPDHAVASSKTFKQLARITGAAPSADGPLVRRTLPHAQLVEWCERIGRMTTAERAALPGVSARRAPLLPAGAIVADAAMDLFDVPELEVCPWALREGVILRRLDTIAS
jgi:exopolyphosphatase / guanosine-5'-triphosphate,3'-diphosphate pyrophosphatase